MSRIDELNRKVTQAIYEAENSNSPDKWIKVAGLEDELAMIPSLSDRERTIAIRGAVNAALKARDYRMAENFGRKYASGDHQIQPILDSYKKRFENQN